MKILLSLLLAVGSFSPAVPALGAVVQSQSAVEGGSLRLGGLPLQAGSAQSLRLGASLLPAGLQGALPLLPAPAVKLRADGAASPVSAAAQPAQASPVSAFQGLVQTGQVLAAAPEEGGQKAGQALDALFTGGLRSGPSLEGFVDFAKGLFFPDGRKAGVVSGRGSGLRAMPTDEEMRKAMELSPLTYEQRLQAVVELFKHAGAKPEEIVLQDAGAGQKNVYVVKKGRSDRVVVVGSHHDKVEEGAGTIDNWTGTTMVANLYQAMRELDTEATYVFASFAREEEGLLGSARYLEAQSPQARRRIDSMVNLDTLAVDGTFSWQNNSTRSLLDLVKRVAAAEKLDLQEIAFDGGDADSSSFRRFGISAITLFGASPEVIFDIIHSAHDTMAAFSMTHYKNAYLLTLALLKMLNLTAVGPDSLAAAA